MGYNNSNAEMHFEKVEEVPYNSKVNSQGQKESFVANEMSGGNFKDGEFKLFINRSDKRKGLVINDPSDLPALMMLIKKLDAKYNK